MSKLLALTLWALAFIAILFLLATDMWAGMVPQWQFVGAALLGVIYPLGTWAIAERYRETDWLAWRFMAVTGSMVAITVLFRLFALL